MTAGVQGARGLDGLQGPRGPTGLVTTSGVGGDFLVSGDLDVSGNVTVGGSFTGISKFQELTTSSNVNFIYKNNTVSLTPGIMADIMATTYDGRIALAKSINFGLNLPWFNGMKVTSLLSAGYSGRNIDYMHLEGYINYRHSFLQHLVHPQEIIANKKQGQVIDEFEKNSFNLENWGANYHPTICTSIGVGFDIKNSYISPAYNVNYTTGIFTNDGIAVYDGIPNGIPGVYDSTYTDDDLVECMEKAYAQHIKVVTYSFANPPLYWEELPSVGDFSKTTLWNEFPLTQDGVSNPLSYILSLAADHDLVFCAASGNSAMSQSRPQNPSPGSGYFTCPTDARNILSVGIWYNNQSYKKNYYLDASGNYNSSSSSGGTLVVGSYHGFGKTIDGRIKPEILGWGEYDTYLPDKIIDNSPITYNKSSTTYTSFTTPKVGACIALLREALPQLDAHQIRECVLLSTGTAPVDTGAGYGLMNTEAALAYGLSRPQGKPPSLKVADSSGGTWVPKSVQSTKAIYDASGSTGYQTAWTVYEAKYNTYVASGVNAWSGSVLDVSPERGLFGQSTRDIDLDAAPIEFNVRSANSWIYVADGSSIDELKDFMVSNGVKVIKTSRLMNAFTVMATSIDQLSAITQGNCNIKQIIAVKHYRGTMPAVELTE